MIIAYQGEPGAYSEAAAMLYRPDAEVLPRPSFEEVFAAVTAGRAACGILPIENSIGGSIHRNYDLLLEHDLAIVGEVEVPIVHCLIAHAGATIASIRRVYSHPQALAQCEYFLRKLGVEIVASYDTAGSVKMIRDEGVRDAAAIASARAAEVFGLAVLQSGVEDFDANVTRFLAVSRSPDTLAEPDKTTIVFSLVNQPGALFKALSVFALRDIDLMKLESRPIRGRPWEYLFYADLAVDVNDIRCARALAHLGEFAQSLRTLGTYPRWARGQASLSAD